MGQARFDYARGEEVMRRVESSKASAERLRNAPPHLDPLLNTRSAKQVTALQTAYPVRAARRPLLEADGTLVPSVLRAPHVSDRVSERASGIAPPPHPFAGL